MRVTYRRAVVACQAKKGCMPMCATLFIDSLRKLKVMEHRILKEVPRSLVGLPDFKSGVGR